MDYYVYCFMDPSSTGKFTYDDLGYSFLYKPFYIGKGKNQRIKAHFFPKNLEIKNYKNNKIKSLLKKGMTPIVEILNSNISEICAYELEYDIIKKIGRIDNGTGPLCNLTDGGVGATGLQNIKKRKKVYQFDINGKLVNSYSSISDASKLTNFFISDISKCCNKTANTHGGFFWSFNREEDRFIINKLNRVVIQYNIDNKIINRFNSVTEASIKLKIRSQYISRSCSGEIKKVKDSYFRFEGSHFDYKNTIRKTKKVILVENGNTLMMNSVKECSEYLNCSRKSIIESCKTNVIYTKKEIYYYDDWIIGKRKIKKDMCEPQRTCIKLDVRNIITSEKLSFRSKKEFSKFINKDIRYINRKIKNNSLILDTYQVIKIYNTENE